MTKTLIWQVFCLLSFNDVWKKQNASKSNKQTVQILPELLLFTDA